MRVDADAFGGVMLERDKHRVLALAGNRRYRGGAPHYVDHIGDDSAVVGVRPP